MRVERFVGLSSLAKRRVRRLFSDSLRLAASASLFLTTSSDGGSNSLSAFFAIRASDRFSMVCSHDLRRDDARLQAGISAVADGSVRYRSHAVISFMSFRVVRSVCTTRKLSMRFRHDWQSQLSLHWCVLVLSQDSMTVRCRISHLLPASPFIKNTFGSVMEARFYTFCPK